jgi:hypothetical protein
MAHAPNGGKRWKAAFGTVAQAADPQTEAAIRVVSWASLGAVKPSENDFAMLRLILAMLPQIGGVVLMIGRGKRLRNESKPVDIESRGV